MAVDTAPRGIRLSRVLMPVMLGVSVMALAAAVMLPPPWRKASPVPVEKPAAIDFPLPAFTLTERSGRPVTKGDLAGKAWVASFVFTRCTGPCPSVTATMTRLQAELNLAAEPDLRLVTFTVDPDRDDPAELTKYAANFRADPDKWLFLTGPKSDIHALLNGSFKIAAGPTKNPNPPAGREIDHSTFLAVVDKSGTVRGYFDGYQGPNDVGGERYTTRLADLKRLVARLLKE